MIPLSRSRPKANGYSCCTNGSEASAVEENFANLSPSQQQELLNFLRSL